jgi:pimeloyl-ACP methyl ester carboxylesterase
MKMTRIVWTLIATVAILLGARPATAQDVQQEFWVVGMAAGAEATNDGMACWRWDQAGQWRCEPPGVFPAAAEPGVPVIFLVHGNPTPPNRAIQLGSRVYSNLKYLAGGRPFRFVLWWWPSQFDKVRRPIMQYEAARGDFQAIGLARCVEQLPPDCPVTLIGYSLGASVVNGALQLLAGGQFSGQYLARGPVSVVRPMRVMNIAPAIENFSLLPGQRFDLALHPIQRMLITVNSADPAMRFYRMLYQLHGPWAMGYAGPAGVAQLDANACKLDLADVTWSVGNTHEWSVYLNSPEFLGRLGWYAFLQ